MNPLFRLHIFSPRICDISNKIQKDNKFCKDGASLESINLHLAKTLRLERHSANPCTVWVR